MGALVDALQRQRSFNGTSKLDSLCMAVVADRSRKSGRKLEDAEQISLNNPTCGDVINLSVRSLAFGKKLLSQTLVVISTYSASMMTDAVLRKDKQIFRTCDHFSENGSKV